MPCREAGERQEQQWKLFYHRSWRRTLQYNSPTHIYTCMHTHTHSHSYWPDRCPGHACKRLSNFHFLQGENPNQDPHCFLHPVGITGKTVTFSNSVNSLACKATLAWEACPGASTERVHCWQRGLIKIVLSSYIFQKQDKKQTNKTKQKDNQKPKHELFPSNLYGS